jgi:hypothetical protein
MQVSSLLPPPMQNETQFQKSFADQSYANTILLCNLGATNLTNTSGSVKKQHETPILRLILKTIWEGRTLCGSVVWVGVVVLSDRLQGFVERIVCSDGDVDALWPYFWRCFWSRHYCHRPRMSTSWCSWCSILRAALAKTRARSWNFTRRDYRFSSIPLFVREKRGWEHQWCFRFWLLWSCAKILNCVVRFCLECTCKLVESLVRASNLMGVLRIVA